MCCTLIGAAQQGYVERLQQLLDAGADIDQTDEHGWSALVWSANGGDLNCVELLLSRKAALHPKSITVATNRPVTQALLDAGANVDQRDDCGWTPLMNAAYRCGSGVVALLLRHGADLDARTSERYAKHPQGSTARDIAALEARPDMVKLLETAPMIVPWSIHTHKQHFSTVAPAFRRCITALLILHRTTTTTAAAASATKRIKACHLDANNRFWKLPKPLLLKLLALVAPPIRFVTDVCD